MSTPVHDPSQPTTIDVAANSGTQPARAVAETLAQPEEDQGFFTKLTNKYIPDQVKHRLNLHAALERSVDNSIKPDIDQASLAQNYGWLRDLFDDDVLDDLFKHEHMGNYVQIRGSDEKIFESMPIYARIGMHLLFYGKSQLRFLSNALVRKLLVDQSVKQGKIYDSVDPEIVVPHIESFIKTYEVDLALLENPDIHSYKTINEFFARRLKANLRPIAKPDDHTIVTSAADCRLMVFQDVDSATKIWIKGKNFSIAHLLGSQQLADQFGPHPSLAVYRLAPQDYHRFHAPVAGVFSGIVHTGSDLYTVNPQAVNENLDVFTSNKRNVVVLRSTLGVPVGFVAIGALLVGAIGWMNKEGDTFKKGDNLGWFQYGGSTCITVFPTGAVTWDADLLATSNSGMETLVKVGEQIGTMKPVV